MLNAELVGPIIEDFFIKNYPPDKILLMIKQQENIVNDLNNIGQKNPVLLKNFMIIINNWGYYITPEKLIEGINGNDKYILYKRIMKSQIGNKWITEQLKILKAYTRVYCERNGIQVKN